MEKKKGIFQTQHSNTFSHYNESSEVDTYLKHGHQHQSTSNDRSDRNVQYGLNVSSEQNNHNPHLRSDSEYKVVQTPEKFSSNVIPSPHPFNNYYVVQYQKTFQSPHYHPAQVPPASNLSHNLVVQNTPQIWVPQQQYYHPQQIQKAEYKSINTQQIPTKNKDPDKKKSTGITHLKSPVAKRPPEAPVTIQGWLHKQGSEGFMLWKKRWFVLSEYCLFYYKDTEEEKLLGSILLPSYKVSVCKPEEKISRKHAFKCEHANMRTYILAADSQELMKQWVQVLNLASTMQTNCEQQKPTNSYSTSTRLKTIDNYEPTGQQYHKTPSRLTPTTHTHSPSSSILQDQGSFNQPLYANAPPKPRRLNDGFSSPSPDSLDRHNPHYVDPRTLDKSPVATYSAVNYNLKNTREGDFQVNRDLERRTPDTYGRSKLTRLHTTDYEDVYAEQQAIYKRPLSPVAYSHVAKRNNPVPVNPSHRYYTPVNMMGPAEVAQYPAPQMRKVPSANITRPHSADFLEYELNHKIQENTTLLKQRPRPKSSLEINGNPNDNDNDFYSKERYAEKMRKSAQYLQNAPPKSKNEMIYNTNEPVRCPTHDHSFSYTDRPHIHTHIPNKPHMNYVQKPQPVRSKSALSEGSVSKEIGMEMDSRQFVDRESLSPDFIYGRNLRSQEYDPFTRSASARLAVTSSQVDRMANESRNLNRDGDRKREESMRRLLEWKQRMLQSPLNRKIQGNIAYRGKPDFYHNHETGYKIRGNSKYSDVCMDDVRSKSSTQYNSYSSDDEASGSISINTRDTSQLAMRDTFPRVMSAKKAWIPTNLPMESRSVTNLSRNLEKDQYGSSTPKVYYPNQASSHPNLTPAARQESWPVDEKVSVSAGELLGRTHEELVLLLIQLRRQSAQTLQAIENYYNEIDAIQAQLYAMDQARRMENLQKLEQIKQHLLELEKQYEKGKPLVNLVDNMVKLGSLYRAPQDKSGTPHIRDRLEFNQQIQERRLLAEEKREWNRLNLDHFQFQEKVQQLYMLDRLIHEESGTLQNLQQDKEDIERALGGLRHRLSKGFKDPSEIELARKQQIMLENELSRVHYMLAQNSKKLEETVSGNARLEHELMVLKQKLQNSRQQSSPQYSNAGDSLTCTIGSNTAVESDLHRVEKKIGELQKQRQKLSLQVRQLTDRSPNAHQQKYLPNDAHNNNFNKKRIHSLWRETDLDTMSIIDHGDYDNPSNKPTPLYINTETKLEDYDYYNHGDSSNNSVSENNLVMPQEKPEIKTVRIVKRESEKRQRDREKSIPGKWDAVQEEDDSSESCNVLFKPVQKIQSSSYLMVSEEDPTHRLNSNSSPSVCDLVEQETDTNTGKSPDISPVFKSEAARQIITEMAVQSLPKQPNRRAIPKERRRHYTAPNNQLIIENLNQLPNDIDTFDKISVNSRRARDDLDMERALRQRIDAPDVVRSTLISTELKYNDKTIDDLLGTPSKINIPERYIPEQLPQLSVEEQEYRLKKVETIKKMLSDTTFISTSSTNLSGENQETQKISSSNIIANKASSKILDEKKQREHLLQLNQILAKQVMEMSKIVAGINSSEEKS